MNVRQAGSVIIPFGKYRGRSIDSVASTDEGMRYLVWLVDRAGPGRFAVALKAYMADPAVKREVDRIVED